MIDVEKMSKYFVKHTIILFSLSNILIAYEFLISLMSKNIYNIFSLWMSDSAIHVRPQYAGGLYAT